MYNIYFDSGTSNTRIYLIKEYKVIDTRKKEIGSKDVSISGNNRVMIEGFKSLYDEVLEYNGLKNEDIYAIYASGMVTCPYGIKVVPHLSTPITLNKLIASIYSYQEEEVFKREINLIRGAKTIEDDYKIDKYNIFSVNNLRGEEMEIFGILSMLPKAWQESDIVIFLPGSHTHIAYIKNNVFCDIFSTFSGELFYAISNSTVLSSSIKCKKNEIDYEMVIAGYKELKEYGFSRALYMAHAMKIFDASNNIERKSFVEGVIAGGVLQGFNKVRVEEWNNTNKIVIAGNDAVAKVYEVLLNEYDKDLEVTMVTQGKTNTFASQGMVEILKRMGK